MKRQKIIFSAVALAMIAGTALLLGAVPQKLGAPGVKASPVPGSERWEVYLPEHVLDFASTNLAPDTNTLGMLPKDTSMADRVYYRPGMQFRSGVVLMGTDRTSIHKAEYCLKGAGMHIDQATMDTVRVEQPQPYDLPIIKIVASIPVKGPDGETKTEKCVYVYWYVADGVLSNDRSGFGRMWSMARQLVLTGVLQRWAYVRFYAFCDPGQEDAAFAVIKRMIADSVPQFQLTHGSSGATVVTKQ